MPLSVLLRLFLAVALILAVVPSSQAAEGVVDKIVAQVGGEMITLFELNERVKNYVTAVQKRPYNPSDPAFKELRTQILQTMIEDILLRQEATRLKASVPDSDVEAQIREMREKRGLSEDQFVQQLKLEGMTRKEFAESLRKEILKKQLLGFMVQRRVLVSDEEVKAYYDANRSGLRSQSGQRIGLILVDKMDEAKALRQRIVSGQISFADAARKYSGGPGADQGGDLGKVEIKDLAPALRQAMENLKPGAVSEPVLLEGKPVILTIIGGEAQSGASDQSGAPSFDSVKDEIRERLYNEKLQKQFTDYMDKLRAKSVIKIDL
jgi:peptidyl-prolyl cis-trans isomerase SurA